jgi:hypothetical protein
MINSRTPLNKSLRLAIDLAIVEHELGNKEVALATLAGLGVCDSVIARVLNEPTKRRKYINTVVKNILDHEDDFADTVMTDK